MSDPSDLTVARFAGVAASVNSWIVAGPAHALVIDALRSEDEARGLADALDASGRRPFAVLVTHGHPDHFIGIRVLLERFPDIRILAASRAVKDDIAGFAAWMESVGWLDAMPRMKPRSTRNPDGFDYEGRIDVHAEPVIEIPGGGRVEISADHPPTEAPHMTTLFVPGAGALFTADLVYNGVHAWLGQGVSEDDARRWREHLVELEARYAGRASRVHPGHGPSGGIDLLGRMRRYLDDFLSAAREAATDEDLTRRMLEAYPRFEQAGFLLAASVANLGPGRSRARTAEAAD